MWIYKYSPPPAPINPLFLPLVNLLSFLPNCLLHLFSLYSSPNKWVYFPHSWNRRGSCVTRCSTNHISWHQNQAFHILHEQILANHGSIPFTTLYDISYPLNKINIIQNFRCKSAILTFFKSVRSWSYSRGCRWEGKRTDFQFWQLYF